MHAYVFVCVLEKINNKTTKKNNEEINIEIVTNETNDKS